MWKRLLRPRAFGPPLIEPAVLVQDDNMFLEDGHVQGRVDFGPKSHTIICRQARLADAEAQDAALAAVEIGQAHSFHLEGDQPVQVMPELAYFVGNLP